DRTRVLVHDGPVPILKARLPAAPHHPRALEPLAEGVRCGTATRCLLRSVWPARRVSASPHTGTRRWTASTARRSSPSRPSSAAPDLLEAATARRPRPLR